MIGDNPLTDYEGGMNAGLTPILVHNKVEGKVCCESLVDLMGVIEE